MKHRRVGFQMIVVGMAVLGWCLPQPAAASDRGLRMLASRAAAGAGKCIHHAVEQRTAVRRELSLELVRSVIGGSAARVAELLAEGADPNAYARDKVFPTGWCANHKHWIPVLTIAAKRGNVQITELLLCYGADVEATDEEGGTALLWAARGSTNASEQSAALLIRRLLAHGASVAHANRRGETPLLWATRSLQGRAMIGVLLEAGAPVLAKDQAGRTALDWVKADPGFLDTGDDGGYLEIIRQLERHAADERLPRQPAVLQCP